MTTRNNAQFVPVLTVTVDYGRASWVSKLIIPICFQFPIEDR